MQCGYESAGDQIVGKAVGVLVSMAAAKLRLPPWMKVLLLLGAPAAGHWIDRNVSTTCPACRAALVAVAAV
jgi:hypothetical protein